MKIKNLLSLASAFCTGVSMADITGSSPSVAIDLATGTRTAAKTETLTYSTEWVSGAGAGAEAVIAIDGETFSSQAGSGTVAWTPTRNGTYELTHTIVTNGVAVGEPLTATFVVSSFPTILPGGSFEFTPAGCAKAFMVENDWVISNGVAKVGDDVSDAKDGLDEPNGKFDIDGNAMFVWQDYVAGTDPTNLASQLTADISMQGKTPIITWRPDLEEKRNYKVWGSTNLVNGGDWEYPTNALHRFFKVTVEMP